jgi:succinylglutamate desuccinylase
MLKHAVLQSVPEKKFHRELGRFSGQKPGPLVICIGGIHGNEPAGALALEIVLKKLREIAPPFRGELIALAGNVRALNSGVRYQHQDLNRMWSPERVAEIEELLPAQSATAEEAEQRELFEIIETALEHHTGEAIFLDLHTTSSEGAPFAIISDTLTNRRLALELGVPVILGLEENLDGTILNYINELGHAAIGFEAGQHRSPASLLNHEAAVWITLAAAGCIKPYYIHEFFDLRQHLKRSVGDVPRVMELRHRHVIHEADQFVMQPGFSNFTRVTKGQLLAKNRNGNVTSPEDGLLFMPLYQNQGDDGFFLVRQVNLFWLKVSARLRKWNFDRLLPRLPGVHSLPESPDSLAINTQIAHWFVVEICHLLGFRKHSQQGDLLIVGRRRQTAKT